MSHSGRAARLTHRGAATRARIVAAAADLVRERGAAGTSLDEVMAASGTSKSQVYHYFGNKRALVEEVARQQTQRIMESQRPELDTLDSLDALRAWRDKILVLQAAVAHVGGCPLGSLANEVADDDEHTRDVLQGCFAEWEGPLLAGLTAMRDRGDLRPDTDPAALTEAVMAAVQGGLLLTKTQRTSRPLARALDMAIDYVASFTASQPAL